MPLAPVLRASVRDGLVCSIALSFLLLALKLSGCLEGQAVLGSADVENADEYSSPPLPPSSSSVSVPSPFPRPPSRAASVRRRPSVFVYEMPCRWNVCAVRQMVNDGFGPVRSLSDGLYDTGPWMLEPIIHHRLLRSGYRTLDPSEADLFYIPYYLTHATARNETDVQVFEYIRAHYESWNRTLGHRHFSTAGRCWGGIAWRGDYERTPLSHNVYFLTIESIEWKGRPLMQNITRVYAVPYPSIYHYSSALGSPTRFPWSPTHGSRRWLVTHIAGARTDLRRTLARQCASAPDLCYAGSEALHNATAKQDFVSAYNASVFCLQPPGDTPTRKGVFDSIVVGCIPVVFHPWTAHRQYPLHLPNAEDYMVYVSEDDVIKGGLNVIDHLAAIPAEAIQRMREALARVAFRTQYAINDPPEALGPDALQVALDAIMAHVDLNHEQQEVKK